MPMLFLIFFFHIYIIWGLFEKIWKYLNNEMFNEAIKKDIPLYTGNAFSVLNMDIFNLCFQQLTTNFLGFYIRVLVTISYNLNGYNAIGA
jgi:hypothetical protein